MATLDKIKVGGVDYDIVDSQARADIEAIKSGGVDAKVWDLSEYGLNLGATVTIDSSKIPFDEVKVGDLVYIDDLVYMTVVSKLDSEGHHGVGGGIVKNISLFGIIYTSGTQKSGTIVSYDLKYGGNTATLEANKLQTDLSGKTIATINGQGIRFGGEVTINSAPYEEDVYFSYSDYRIISDRLGYDTIKPGDVIRFAENDLLLIIGKVGNGYMPWYSLTGLHFDQYTNKFEVIAYTNDGGGEFKVNKIDLSALGAKQDKMTGNYLSKVDVGGSSISIETKAFADESVQKTDTVNFKTINGNPIFGMGNIEIDVDTSDLAPKSDLGGLKLVKISQADYDGLGTKDNNTLYIIVD